MVETPPLQVQIAEGMFPPSLYRLTKTIQGHHFPRGNELLPGALYTRDIQERIESHAPYNPKQN